MVEPDNHLRDMVVLLNDDVNDAFELINNAQTTADDAKTTAADAKTTAADALYEARTKMVKYDLDAGEIDGLLDLQVGESLKVTKPGYFVDPNDHQSNAIACMKIMVRDTEYSIIIRYAPLICIDKYAATGTFFMYRDQGDGEDMVFSVLLRNLATTSYIRIIRIV